MTLIAGFRCTDGFVIAADTEITLGDTARVQGHKLLTSGLSEPYTFCIAFSGDVGYGLAASKRVRDAIRQLRPASFANIRRAIDDALADFYDQHMRHNWPEIGIDDPPSFDLIVGFQGSDPNAVTANDPSNGFGVVATDREVVYDVEDAIFLGSGYLTASTVAERLFDNRNHPTALAQHLAQQLFREVKSKGAYVGGNTEILSRRCLSAARPFFTLPSFESERAALWGLEEDLWVAIRNALNTEYGRVPGKRVAPILDAWLKELNWKIER